MIQFERGSNTWSYTDLITPIKINGELQFNRILWNTSWLEYNQRSHLHSRNTLEWKDHSAPRHRSNELLPPEIQRESSTGKQRVSEKSRTDLHTYSQCSGFTDQWGLCPKIYIMRKARDSEFERILMSNSVHHCYQDDSYVDPDCTRSIYTQMDNGLQINLTNSNITALCSIYGNNLGLHPQYTSPATSNRNAATRHSGS